MRKWKVVAMLLAAGLCAPAFAQQSNDDLQKQMEQLRKELSEIKAGQANLAAENADLRRQLDQAPAHSQLEESINALAESMDYAGTTVKSHGGADSITIHGLARVRSAWTFDRDFGAQAGGDDHDDDGSFVDARFGIGFDFALDKDITVRYSVESIGLFSNGDTPTDSNEFSDVHTYEAYIQTDNIFGRKELGARTGRQEIVLGNEFQFGNNDFFGGETFDGTHWWWDSENFTLHALLLKLAITNDFNTRDHSFTQFPLSGGHDDDEVYSLYFTLKSIEHHVIDLYWIYFNGHNGSSLGTLGNPLGSPSIGDSVKGGAGSTFYYHTFGARIAGEFDVAAGLDYNIEFAYQTGDINSAPTLDVDAFAFEGEVGLTFSDENNFRIFIRGNYVEGADTDDAGYIPLFTERHSQAGGSNGNRRARYGLLDIIPLDNVWSIQAGIHFDPASDWTLGLGVIYAGHDEDVATPTGLDDSIGFEIDAFAEYRYSKQATFSGGIGVFFADDGAPLKGGGFAGDDDDIAFLFYLQALVVF